MSQPQQLGGGMGEDISPLSVVRGLFVAQPPSALAGGYPDLEVLSGTALEALYDQGFCVIDAALDPAMAHCAGAEALVKERDRDGGFEDAGLVGQDARVRDDRTVFLRPERGPVGSPLLVAAADLMSAVHRDVASAVRLRHGATRPELQLAAYNSPGAHYARHRDGFPTGGGEEEEISFQLTGQGPMWRRVTAILYLNGPWDAAADGGALRLYQPAQALPTTSTSVAQPASSREGQQQQDDEGAMQKAEEWQDVDPIGGRLVVFLAGAVEHEVRPAYAPRVALTAWFS